MRIVFMGTPATALPALEALHSAHEVVLVVTQPDKPAGRGNRLSAPPVKQWAVDHGVPVTQPERARDEGLLAELKAVAADVIAVVAYGQILPAAILSLPPRGCINLHYSLLPRWRGAAPVQYAILHGDEVTGVSTQWMALKLDAGDIILQQSCPIPPGDTAGQLLDRLAILGADTLSETLRQIDAGTAPRVPQDAASITLAPTIKKEDARLNWTDGAPRLERQVRAYNPWPVAWCEHEGDAIRVWQAVAVDSPAAAPPGTVVAVAAEHLDVATGDGVLRLLRIQGPGRPQMDAAAWARGHRIKPGQAQLS